MTNSNELSHHTLPYTSWTQAQLRRRCDEEGIDYSNLTVGQMIESLEARDDARANAPHEV